MVPVFSRSRLNVVSESTRRMRGEFESIVARLYGVTAEELALLAEFLERRVGAR